MGAMDEFVHSPVQVVAALVTIGLGLSAAFKEGRQFWTNFWAWLRAKPVVPTETLRIVQDVQQSHWGLGSSAGTPSMQVVFNGHVTDISGRLNKVLRVDIPKPPTPAMMLLLHHNHDARRPQALQPFENTGIDVMFFVQPVVAEKGKPWKATLIFTDQYGNQHKLRNCVFRSLPTPPEGNPAG